VCGISCFIGQCFVGALAYANNDVLLASSANVMRKLVALCNNFGEKFN